MGPWARGAGEGGVGLSFDRAAPLGAVPQPDASPAPSSLRRRWESRASKRASGAAGRRAPRPRGVKVWRRSGRRGDGSRGRGGPAPQRGGSSERWGGAPQRRAPGVCRAAPKVPEVSVVILLPMLS